MSISEKMKTINNKIEQKKALYDLDRQTAKISALLSGNVGKNEFLTGKDILPEKELLGKAAIIERSEYSLLGKELKKQTSIAEKEYQKIDNTYEPDRIKNSVTKKYNRSNLIHSLAFKNIITLILIVFLLNQNLNF